MLQYSHLIDTFMDKNALIIICIDCLSIQNQNNISELVDLIFLKICKTTTFRILPVLTKCDMLSSPVLVKQACEKIETLLAENLRTKLNEIRVELKKIESLSQINASQSDRLKHLAQTLSNLNPDIHNQCIPVSSLKMLGIEQLAGVIREIVVEPKPGKKVFLDVNKKVPVFWTEVENFACNKLAEMPSTKNMSESGKIRWNQPQTMNMFCMEFSDLKV